MFNSPRLISIIQQITSIKIKHCPPPKILLAVIHNYKHKYHNTTIAVIAVIILSLWMNFKSRKRVEDLISKRLKFYKVRISQILC